MLNEVLDDKGQRQKHEVMSFYQHTYSESSCIKAELLLHWTKTEAIRFSLFEDK